VEKISATLDRLLAQHLELTETLYDDAQLSSVEHTIDALKKRLEVEKDRKETLKNNAKRKRELEKMRKS
jgi:hypothetical protein